MYLWMKMMICLGKIIPMKIEIKGFEVWFGAFPGSDNYSLSIPKLKIIHKIYNLKKNPIAVLEQKANEIINENKNNERS